ncbi:MAG: hypothetical protein WA917_10875 [Comamonas sp.]|nr:hypothetical protein [Comamonas sp.]
MDSISRIAHAVTLTGLSCCCAATGQTLPADQPHAFAPLPVEHAELSLEALPDGVRSGALGNRLAVTRWGDAGVGVSLGMRTTRWPPLASGAGAVVGGADAVPASWGPQLGVHWSSRLSGRWRVKVSGWADLPSTGDGAFGAGQGLGTDLGGYTAQVQVQWQSARYGDLIPEYGAIGVQLQGGSRLMLRARHGGPMIYYRVRF